MPLMRPVWSKQTHLWPDAACLSDTLTAAASGSDYRPNACAANQPDDQAH